MESAQNGAPQNVGNENPPPSSDDSNLYVNDISEMSHEELKNLFSPYGTILRSTVMSERTTGRKLGYGFVQFETRECAEKAVQALNGHLFNGRQIKVSFARPKSAAPAPTERITPTQNNVYLASLPLTYTKQDLDSLCSQYGTIHESRILTDPQGQSRGIGFVRYLAHHDALRAITALNGSVPPNGTEPLVAKFARDKAAAAPRPPPAAYYPPSVYPSYAPVRAHGRTPYGMPPVAPYGMPPAGYPYARPPPVEMGYERDFFPPQPPVNHVGTTPLYVYYLPADISEEVLYNMFAQYGEVASVTVMRNPESGLCKGYGFVNMTNVQEATNAITALNGFPIQGKFLKVAFKEAKRPVMAPAAPMSNPPVFNGNPVF